MQFLVPLAGLLGIEIETLTERFKHAFALYAMMAVFGIIGVGFLVGAGYLAIAEQLGPLPAALVMAGLFLLLALIVLLMARAGENRRRRLAIEKRRSTDTSAFVTTAALTALPVLLRSSAVRTLGIPAAALAAFLLMRGNNRGDKP